MALHVLVVGSGAREHALCWRLAGEPGVGRVTCAPGNALMRDVADVRADIAADDHAGLVQLAIDSRVDLVVVGPEAPLAAGLADRFTAAGVRCFGPSAAAARLESSKAFARDVCAAAGVAMARGRAFEDASAALDFAAGLGGPVVIKADGLAAGKGVTVCETLGQAEAALREALLERRFGAAGRRVVVEEYLAGRELSLIAVCDATTSLMLPPARDHKRLLDGDRGPNTGGMGAYSPVPDLTPEVLRDIADRVVQPVLAEMAHRGTPFRGALFAGLMLTDAGPRVLEFNVRFGDPETQAILPRLATPLARLLLAATCDRLRGEARDAGIDGTFLPVTEGAAVALTLAARGYPDAAVLGDEVSGLAQARAGALVFGAGVGESRNGGGLRTTGGRVVTVVGRGRDLPDAADSAYRAAAEIDFRGRQMRRDIGRAALPVAATVAVGVST